jgi:anti-sigma28 factor (negative regulator of flagellin synthesis)
MQISDSNNSISGLRKTPEITPNQNAPLRGPGGQAFAADQIQLSTLGAHLSAAQGNSPAQLEKVLHLAAAVGNGAYRVDAQEVSGSIITDSLRFSAKYF